MIEINIPNNNINERKYILDIIFNEFLGLKYDLELGSKDYEIILHNGKTLTIKDTFFNKYPKDLEYLKYDNIPKKIVDLDIFAASFFMLTRWEEYVNKTRDKHNRFSACESLAYKQGFLDKPIVNEYVEELKGMLLSLDNNLKFKKRKYQLILTHDVDHIAKWDSLTKITKQFLGDIVLRCSLKEFYLNVFRYISFVFGKQKDPFDTFDYLMDLSDKYSLKSYFFFMGEGVTSYDNNYKLSSKKVYQIVKKIKKRGHKIGMHATYDAYNDTVQFEKEKNEIESTLKTKIIFGREHYLRFEIPTTWQVWEDNNMEWDSTLAYADKEGFRCGVCYEYSVFNILTREKLNLKEKPLIVMDGSFLTYQPNIKSKDMQEKILHLVEQVKKYDGTFVLLWHNSSFNTMEWKEFQPIYERILKEG